MSNYLNRVNLLASLAKKHPDIRHQEIMQGDKKRKSFYKSTDDLVASNVTGGQFPCVVFNRFQSRLIDKNGDWRLRNYNQWLFLDKVKIDKTSPSYTAAVIEVTDRMEKIVLEFVSYLLDDYEELGGCGLFKDLDVSSFHWEEEGPVADHMYGWRLSFQDEMKRVATPEGFWLP